MGAAIAEVGAAAGLAVRVRDTKPEAVAKGLARIGRMVDEGVKRRRFQPREGREIVQRVSGTTDYSGFCQRRAGDRSRVRRPGIKHRVIQELEAVLDPEAVIASNTSALPIHQIASAAKHPERVVGMHFFSPAERMPLLEVIRPAQADRRAVATAASVGSRMGKTVIVVGDSPGFYTSRVLGVMMNEAVVLLVGGRAARRGRSRADRLWLSGGSVRVVRRGRTRGGAARRRDRRARVWRSTADQQRGPGAGQARRDWQAEWAWLLPLGKAASVRGSICQERRSKCQPGGVRSSGQSRPKGAGPGRDPGPPGAAVCE